MFLIYIGCPNTRFLKCKLPMNLVSFVPRASDAARVMHVIQQVLNKVQN